MLIIVILFLVAIGATFIFDDNKPHQTQEETESDISLDREIKLRKSRIEKFDSIVGDSALKQLDWILENGLDKFNDTYDKVLDGKWVDEKTEPKILPPLSPNKKYASRETMYVMGGVGNGKLLSWDIRREIEEVDEE